MKDKEYYNDVYTKRASYDVSYKESEYYELWKRVYELMQERKNRDNWIIELGCGTGQFAEMLWDKGIRKYIGIDWSLVAINKAIKRVQSNFKCIDFYDAEIITLPEHGLYDKIELIIALEVLEHIDDIKLLKILSGRNIIFTVPDFDDPAHLRKFNTEDEIRDRYTDLVNIESIEKYFKYFIVKGKVK